MAVSNLSKGDSSENGYIESVCYFAIGLNNHRIFWVFLLKIASNLKLAVILMEITLFAAILPVLDVENTEINGRLKGEISLYWQLKNHRILTDEFK